MKKLTPALRPLTSDSFDGLLDELSLTIKERDLLMEAAQTLEVALMGGVPGCIDGAMAGLLDAARNIRQCVEQRRGGRQPEGGTTSEDIQITVLPSTGSGQGGAE